jgi:hypothetical protein
VLVLIHPKNLTDDAQYAIDRSSAWRTFAGVRRRRPKRTTLAPTNNPSSDVANKSSTFRSCSRRGACGTTRTRSHRRTRALQISMTGRAAGARRGDPWLGQARPELNDVTTANLDSVNISSTASSSSKRIRNKLVR